MRILYVAVHGHRGWGAEHWLALAFERLGCTVERYDYRARRKRRMPWWMLRRQLLRLESDFRPDVVLLQRAERMPPSVPRALTAPVVFWSTEPLARRRDVDQLLAAGEELAWIYLHTYTCLAHVERRFPLIVPRCSVMHNAASVETFEAGVGRSDRPRLAIFNRNLSPRRREWLAPSADLVDIIEGRFGETYFRDLAESLVALNVHYAESSVDDFESGIFEALASGCVVVTETLNPRTVADMGMADALVQVDSPSAMRAAIEALAIDPSRTETLRARGREAIARNLWDARAEEMLERFRSVAQGSTRTGAPL